jgi:hypothetical protein
MLEPKLRLLLPLRLLPLEKNESLALTKLFNRLQRKTLKRA